MFNRKNVSILKHHRTSDVYIDGRYLHVSMKTSLKSKRAREVARETALTILQTIEEAEDGQTVIIGHEQSTGRPIEQGERGDPSL